MCMYKGYADDQNVWGRAIYARAGGVRAGETDGHTHTNTHTNTHTSTHKHSSAHPPTAGDPHGETV